MATTLLRLRRGSDGYYRTSWVAESGQRFTRSLGRVPSRARNRFAAFQARWAADYYVRNPDAPAPLTIREIWERFYRHAQHYYRRPDGTATGEARNFYDAMRFVLDCYGELAARDFGPRMLVRVRDEMIAAGLSLGVINQRISKVRHVFKWLVGKELVPAAVWHALCAVAPLRAGRSRARVHPPVQPVAEDFVWAVCQVAPPAIAAMIKLQWLTGMRPAEVCCLRPMDLEHVGEVWVYRPKQHKTAHRGRRRAIPLGPKARAVLEPFLSRDLGAFAFSPRETRRWLDDQRNTHRRQTVKPPQTARRIGQAYTAKSYGQAIRRLCDGARVPRWSPNQLRHNVGQRLRVSFGLDVAQAMLGHSRADVTELYATLDLQRAIRAMEQVG